MNILNIRQMTRPGLPDKVVEQLVELLEKHIKDAFREGYLQGQADERRRI